MKKFKQLASVLLALLVLNSAYSATKKTKDAEPVTWTENMKQLSSTLSTLMPALYSDEEFNKLKDKPEFGKAVHRLSELSHSVNKKAMGDASRLPHDDPSLKLISDLLKDITKQAATSFDEGQKEYAQAMLKQATSLCFSCHTSNRLGPEFHADKDPEFFAKLNSQEKADYLVATRNFDKASNLYSTAAHDVALAKAQNTEWRRAVRNAIALAVRVQRSPDKALELVREVKKSKYHVSPSYLEDLKTWEASLKDWKSEGTRYASFENEAKNWEYLDWLAQKAQTLQKFPADRSAEIYFLRLSAATHEFLATYPESKKTADALYYLGLSYDAMRGFAGQWLLQDIYYESCIRQSPNTPTSKKCFEKYRDSMYLGYTGSRGTDLPLFILFRLQELGRLAQ
jgi:hypothetical protein